MNLAMVCMGFGIVQYGQVLVDLVGRFLLLFGWM